MNIKNSITELNEKLIGSACTLVAVSKRQPVEKITQAYAAGQRMFGENQAQELVIKQPQLPQDIQWHMIGHLQRNKVKYIAPFVAMIQSVDSWSLLQEIHKQGARVGRIIPCLLQVRIAQEETKFGLQPSELQEIATGSAIEALTSIQVVGLMGMASFSADAKLVSGEFKLLHQHFCQLKENTAGNVEMKELSMGMSADYALAIQEGSTLIRVGSAIFGERENINKT